MLYDDVPYLVLYYYGDLEAYRSDLIAKVIRQPQPDGVIIFQYGTYTYRNIMTQADWDVQPRVGGGAADLGPHERCGAPPWSLSVLVGAAVLLRRWRVRASSAAAAASEDLRE